MHVTRFAYQKFISIRVYNSRHNQKVVYSVIHVMEKNNMWFAIKVNNKIGYDWMWANWNSHAYSNIKFRNHWRKRYINICSKSRQTIEICRTGGKYRLRFSKNTRKLRFSVYTHPKSPSIAIEVRNRLWLLAKQTSDHKLYQWYQKKQIEEYI